jgi:SAM-dependent methyltransferase
MHDTAKKAGEIFGKIYGTDGVKVLDVGGKYVNGSIREYYENTINAEFIVLDIEEDNSVDVVMKPGDPFPFENESFDLIVSTSCFEHDPCFWLTFREMCRIVKKNGYIYVNAPSNGVYHNHPGDNWRFYSDAGQALAYWSGKELDGKSWPVKVIETFHILPKNDIWTDFVCVWQRTDIKETEIIVSNEIRNKIGPLRQELDSLEFTTKTTF